MKALFLVLLFTFLSLASDAQVLPDPAPTPPTGVEDVYLAKDDGSGKAGEVVSTFRPADIPIHCIVQLDSTKVYNVKMNLVAVKVNGVKPETKVVSVNYTTNGNQNQVNFTGKPDKLWTPGKYRVDVFLDGKLAKNYDFLIEKDAAGSTQAADDKTVNAFQPKQSVKPKAQPRKMRRN